MLLKTKYFLRGSIFNNCKQIWRNSGTSVVQKSEVLTARKEEQQKYAKHPNILYSSYLEFQEEYMEPRRLAKYNTKMARGKQQQNYENSTLRVEDYPMNWMEDYEFYKGHEEETGILNATTYGNSVDPSMPPSSVQCNGCGAQLHCASVSLPGYIPKEIFKGRTTKELQTIVCKRCHFLKQYNIALDLEVAPETYVQTISRIRDEYALAIVIVDLLDFPCSIWPGMQELLGRKRPVFVVGNKVDLLPRDSNGYLERVKQCLKQNLVQTGFDALNIKYISLISAKTGYGIEELITQLHKIWLYKGNVYLLGCTNVGKSTLFNILLNSDYCRPEATDLVRKATTCPWPGTTLHMLKFPILRPSEIRVYYRFRRLFSERGMKAAEEKLRRDQARKHKDTQAAKLIGNVGRTFDRREDAADSFSMSSGTAPIITLNERALEYKEAKWCYDTPGVMHPDQITTLLTAAELLKLESSEMIRPRAYRIAPGMSLFLAGIGRLDFIDFKQTQTNSSDWIKALVFSSLTLPVMISATEHAEELYKLYLGTNLLGVPNGAGERLERWAGLQCKSDVLHVQAEHEEGLACDIMLSSAGWIGLALPYGSEGTFKAWTPYARGIYIRKPPLIPLAERLVGKRIRNSLAYNLAKPFIFKK